MNTLRDAVPIIAAAAIIAGLLWIGHVMVGTVAG